MYAVSAVSVSESGVRPVLADAAEVARRALVELEPEGVGEHLGVTAEDETAATHRFATTLAGYRGWQWAVVVAAPPEAEYATVSESALLPGPDALIAPDFIPWEQRVRPGDLGPGDLLAPPADDPRLVPGYVATGDPVVDEVAREVGLGRTQVLSLEGRVEAAQRWYTEFGPDTEMAKAAPSTCGLCGFYLPLAGALRESFGVCGNAMGADGHVVHIEYGCGAHSDVVAPSGNGSPRYEAFDDHAVDIVEVVRVNGAAEGADAAAADADNAQAATVVSAESTATEPVLDQETAEAEAADAAAADRAALAEGATPESADEVVAAEQAPESESLSATDRTEAAADQSTTTASSSSAETAADENNAANLAAAADAAAAAAAADAAAADAAAGDAAAGDAPTAGAAATSGADTTPTTAPAAAGVDAAGTAAPAAESASAGPAGAEGGDARSSVEPVVAEAAASAASAPATAAAGEDQVGESLSAAEVAASVAIEVEVPPASGPATEAPAELFATDTAAEQSAEPTVTDAAAESPAELTTADAADEVPAEPIAADTATEVSAEPIAVDTATETSEPTANVGIQAVGESVSAEKPAADDVAQPGGESVAQEAADAAGSLAAAAAGDDQPVDETDSAADGVASIAAAAEVDVPPASGPAGAEGEPVDEHGSSVAR
ncbi:hypothetical protein NCAST_13_02050 [Nocardia asteroides NBRC 15531]|uniref:DUF3027 domain-containing protein n=1 Tax=Nocardia asteroides NBRC 15531 TaxID=1110697 RepID=U5E6S4_NOCAS|nr:hypothetical protein NCAST_13_02050 [Nocardia asteroides NBRC 15531]